jgi:hypothetical protein
MRLFKKEPTECYQELYSLFVRVRVDIGQLPCQFQARLSIGDRKRSYEKKEMTKEMNKNWRNWIYRGWRGEGERVSGKRIDYKL